ncbi:MAG: PKD domain-containing protein [Anaerolineae bacterium]|nr:PKD domain-containing protein [Anaerolineae bacterium]
MLKLDGRLRLYALTTIMILTALIVGACNLSSAPEEQLELTDVPTSTILPTRTLVGDSNAPTPITVTALAVTPTTQPQLPGTSVSFPPTVIPFPSSTPLPINILIYSPVPGNIVAGNVQVLGAATHPQFLQYQLEYGPDPNPGNAWFAATGISQVPVFNGQLGVWNTTVITDGVYQLRLRVVLRDGTSLVTVVNQIRVQNRVPTPVPTNTTIPRPIAAFTQDRVSGQAPLVVRFFNQSSGSITSYSWDFGDGSNSPEVNPAHTFRTPGVYTVRLRVRGPGGGSNVSRQISVQSGAPPVAGFVQDKTSGPSPLTIQFTDRSTGNITSREWNFGDGETSTQPNPSHTFTAVGTYNTILTVYGPGGSSSVRRQITVENPTIPEPIAALVASPTEGQAPLTVQFDASDSSGQIDAYNWDFGDGETDQGQIVGHVYTQEGTYEAELVVVGPGGQSRRTTTITVTRPPDAPTAAFTSSPESGTIPLTVQFDATTSSGEINSYSWDFGDGETGQGATVSHVYDEVGTYTVTLIVTGPGGNATATAEISATPPIEPPSAAFTASPEAGPAPLEVEFTNQSSGDGLSFSWDFGDGETSQEIEPIHTYANAGQYTVTLTVNGISDTDTAQGTITVTEPEAPPVASFSAIPASGPAPLEVQFVNETLGENLSFSWDFGDNSPTSADRDPVHTYADAGDYTVVLTAKGLGSESNAENTIVVSEEVVIAPPTAQFTALPSSGEAPLIVQFNAVESDNITEYRWDFGDQVGTGNGPAASYTYQNSGNYIVTLTVSGPGGTSNAQSTISVSAPLPEAPVPSISANPTSGETPLTVQFDATGSTGQIDAYAWDFGDQVGFANGATTQYTYQNSGNYTVILTVTGPGGTNTAQITIGASAPPPEAPTAAINANPTSGEAPLTVQFDATGSTGQIDTYAWDFGDQVGFANGATTQYTYPNAGDYTVTLTVTGPGGTNTAQTTISASAPPPEAPTAAISANPTSGETPLTVQFDATGSIGQIDTYTWDFGDQVGTGNGATTEYTYPNAGDYTVTLTVTGPGGTNTAQTTISASAPPPEAPTAAISANPTNGEAPLTVQFDATGSTGQIDTYAWDFGDQVGFANGATTQYTYPSAGDYTVTLTVTGPGGTNTAQTTISASAPPPEAPTAAISANPTNGEAPLTVQFDATSSTGQIDTYAWDFGDQVGFANGATTEYTYPSAGDYTVTLTVTGPGGTNTAQTAISVTAAQEPEPPDDGIVSQTPVIPDFSPQSVRDALRNLYVNGVNQGNRASVFAIIGDGQALQPGYLSPLADPNVNNDGSGLQEIINWYRNTDVGDGRTSFERRSVAAGQNWRAQDFLDPANSDASCNPGETPIDCELRLIQPSVALVSLGAADIANNTDPAAFRGQMEQILQVLVNHGVIPVVSTTQPNPGNPQQANAINTAIIEAVHNVEAANNTAIPIYNQWLAFTNLPNNGLAEDNASPSIAPSGAGNLADSPASRFGMNARNRDTMVILDELRNFVFPDATP